MEDNNLTSINANILLEIVKNNNTLDFGVKTKPRISASIINKKISGKIHLQNLNREKEISFTNCIFQDPILFQSYEPIKSHYSFIECQFNDSVNFIEGKFLGDIIFLNCSFNDKVYFDEGIYSNITFHESNISNGFEIAGSEVNKLIISGNAWSEKEAGWITLQEPKSKSILIENITLKTFNCIRLIPTGTEVAVTNVKCDYIKLKNVLVDGVLQLSNVHPLMKQESIFSIDNCNLGKAEFYNINFDAFERFMIDRSILIDCVFVNVIWPDDIEIGKDASKHGKTILLLDKKEVYRQIKYALSKQGNTYDEQTFHAKELNTIYKSLTFRKHPWTKSIIGLSYLSSEYGLSIWRPIAFLLVVNGLLFWWYINIGDLPITESIRGGSFLRQAEFYIGEFINYSNPLHRNDERLSGYQFLVDALMRIVSSYSIYNFIRASRRFIK